MATQKAKTVVKSVDLDPPRLPWFDDELMTAFTEKRAWIFLLHGDIYGIVPNEDVDEEPDHPYICMRTLWKKSFEAMDLVVQYNIASGFTFPSEKMEQAFKKAAGIGQTNGTPITNLNDPIARAQAQIAAAEAEADLPKDPSRCLPLIEKVLLAHARVAVLIDSVHFLVPATGGGAGQQFQERVCIEYLRNWSFDERIRDQGNIVLLFTDQSAKTSPELRGTNAHIQTVLIPKPSLKERVAYFSAVGKNDSRKNQDPARIAIDKDVTIDQLAHATQGMSLLQIHELFEQSKRSGTPLNLGVIKQKKRHILNDEYGEVMEIVDPELGLENIGGLQWVKEYFLEVLEGIKSGDPRRVPMGITLSGPPGTGKTAIVEALAKEAGFNCAKTKNVRSMWIGESERNMELLIQGLLALAPIIVMNDEADLAEADRTAPKGDSGVSERLMKMWMELRSDPKIRGKIIVISCTNRPDRIDPALKRRGRSDANILLPMPSRNERGPILEVMFRRHKIPVPAMDLSPIIEATSGFSGADLEDIVLKAYRMGSQMGHTGIEMADLEDAVADFIASASQRDNDLMTMLGLLESTSRKLVPPHALDLVNHIRERNLVPGLEAMLTQLRARRIVDVPV